MDIFEVKPLAPSIGDNGAEPYDGEEVIIG